MGIFHLLGLEKGVIRHKLVTEPRITDIYWISLCNFIAYQYKTKVELLKDATNFQVEHFLANVVIGFNRETDNPKKLKEYDARLKASCANLPEKIGLQNIKSCIYITVVKNRNT
jgi:hypothetical protein